jgi:hypothetical protein
MTWGRNLLLLSGLTFVPLGIFLTLSWNPSPRPYELGARYPFGGYVEALLVSNGFAFLGFGILFSVFVLLSTRLGDRLSYFSLLSAWALVMFPHLLIGIAFFADEPSRALSLLPGTLLILVWAGSGVLGLVLSGMETLRKTSKQHESLSSP